MSMMLTSSLCYHHHHHGHHHHGHHHAPVGYPHTPTIPPRTSYPGVHQPVRYIGWLTWNSETFSISCEDSRPNWMWEIFLGAISPRTGSLGAILSNKERWLVFAQTMMEREENNCWERGGWTLCDDEMWDVCARCVVEGIGADFQWELYICCLVVTSDCHSFDRTINPNANHPIPSVIYILYNGLMTSDAWMPGLIETITGSRLVVRHNRGSAAHADTQGKRMISNRTWSF